MEKIKVTSAQVAAIDRLVSGPNKLESKDEIMQLHAAEPIQSWSLSSGLCGADMKTIAALLWFPETLEVEYTPGKE